MVEVRLRGDEGEAVVLGDVPLTRQGISDVMALVREWGIHYDGYLLDNDNLFGQFALRNGRAFFEIVDGGDDE